MTDEQRFQAIVAGVGAELRAEGVSAQTAAFDSCVAARLSALVRDLTSDDPRLVELGRQRVHRWVLRFAEVANGTR